jgi:proteasome lid subunit RPN8/RPN11
MNLNDYFSEFATLAEATPDKECVAFLLHNGEGSLEVVPTPNIAANPKDQFLVSYKEQSEIYKTQRVVALVHSHTDSAPLHEKITEPDIECANSAELPFMVYSVVNKQWDLFVPEVKRPSLDNRPFLLGFTDCVSLASDVMALHGLKLPYFPRNDRTLRYGFLSAGALLRGLSLRTVSNPLPGDLVMFKVGTTDAPNHVGIIDKEGRLLHQLLGRKSCREVFSDSWRNMIHSVWRHTTPLYA